MKPRIEGLSFDRMNARYVFMMVYLRIAACWNRIYRLIVDVVMMFFELCEFWHGTYIFVSERMQGFGTRFVIASPLRWQEGMTLTQRTRSV